MIKKIQLTAFYGNELKHVVVSNPYGGGAGYHVYINKRYNGTIVKRNGEWVGLLNPKSDLKAADIELFGEIVDARYPEDED